MKGEGDEERVPKHPSRDGSDVGIVVVATPYEEYREDWWHSQDSARKTVLELAKLVYYYAGGRFISAPAP